MLSKFSVPQEVGGVSPPLEAVVVPFTLLLCVDKFPAASLAIT